VQAEAKDRFASLVGSESKSSDALPSDYKAPVYKIVLAEGGQEEYDQLMGLYEYYDGLDSAAERASIYAAAGAPTDLSLKRQTLLWALNDLKLQDFFYPMRSVAASDRAGADLAWTFYQENFEVNRCCMMYYNGL
jgi:hypothetical protein